MKKVIFIFDLRRPTDFKNDHAPKNNFSQSSQKIIFFF